MPEVIPIIVGIVSAASGAAGLGEIISSAVGGSGTPKAPSNAPPQVTPAQAQATKTAQEASLQSAFPNIQALTGGSLSPESWLQLSQLVTGQANAPGIGAASQDILSKLTGSAAPSFSVSAGNTPSSPSYSSTGLVPGASYA